MRPDGPFIIPQRKAWSEPIWHLINERGALPFTPCQSMVTSFSLPEEMEPHFSPKKEEEPQQKVGTNILSRPREGNQTSPATPKKNLRKARAPSP